MNKKKVAVFSGSKEGTGEYIELAQEIGKALAQNNLTVVNGGGPGLMEVIAKGAYENGGEVIGVHFEFEGRNPSKYNTETLSYTELYPRQQKIISLADAFVILPGGLGTIFELFEILAKKYLQEIDKDVPIILVSQKFWKNTIEMLQVQVEKGFMNKEFFENFLVVESAQEIIKRLK